MVVSEAVMTGGLRLCAMALPSRGKSATHLPAVRALKMADDEGPYHGNTELMR